ncbi:unnamed protein product [Phytophthora fragariaefolia]|uniref:Unnamed protein product n=1 Tax=Phytophthora fragariaefolia TaxID=1490495 RepID=A0A9W6XM34_9STRA|nr:unnamed protein product [Phytophthora fragariaefolia]
MIVDGGARKDEMVGEDLRVLRIDRVGSPAWTVYKDWACSLGEVDPLVQAVFAPPVNLLSSPLSPPVNLAFQIFTEVNSIINHMAPLRIADFTPVGIPVLPDPLPGPLLMVNIRHAEVAVTGLIEAIANPGANYPVINALNTGVYICDVQYAWTGGTHITISVHKR